MCWSCIKVGMRADTGRLSAVLIFPYRPPPLNGHSWLRVPATLCINLLQQRNEPLLRHLPTPQLRFECVREPEVQHRSCHTPSALGKGGMHQEEPLPTYVTHANMQPSMRF